MGSESPKMIMCQAWNPADITQAEWNPCLVLDLFHCFLMVSKPPTWKCQTDRRTSVNLTYERHYSWSLRPYGKFYCWLLLHLHLVKGCQGYTSYLLIVLLVSISPSFPIFFIARYYLAQWQISSGPRNHCFPKVQPFGHFFRPRPSV